MNKGVEGFFRFYSNPGSLKTALEGKTIREKGAFSPIAMLAEQFIASGREGLIEANKSLGRFHTSHSQILRIFMNRAPNDLAAVIIGCTIRGIEDMLANKAFDFPQLYSRLQEAVKDTPLIFPEMPKQAEKIPDDQWKKMILKVQGSPAYKIPPDKTLYCLFEEEDLLPLSLKSYLIDNFLSEDDPFKTAFVSVLNAYRKFAQGITIESGEYSGDFLLNSS